MFGSISSAIYMTDDGSSLLSSWVVTTELRKSFLSCFTDRPPFSLKWIFRKQKCTPVVVWWSAFEAKRKSAGWSFLSGLILFMVCRYWKIDYRCQACGKPSEDVFTAVCLFVAVFILPVFFLGCFKFACVCPSMFVCDLWTGSRAGSKEVCNSDLLLMSAFGQQVCVCAGVCVWTLPVWSQI